MWRAAWMVAAGLLAGSCGDAPRDVAYGTSGGIDTDAPEWEDEPPLRIDTWREAPRPPDREPAVFADPPPPPITGGTMILSEDDAFAYAADTDRDALYIVDVEARELVRTVQFDAGTEPGRLVEDAAGLVHVIGRGSGEIITVDPETGRVLARYSACRFPRGLADDSDGSVVVACADGVVARIDTDGTISTVDVGHELRDVVDVGPPLRVSTFREASVLTVDDDGTVIDVVQVTDDNGHTNTARRTIRAKDGGWHMLHQIASLELIEPDPGEAAWGECGAAQRSAISTWIPGGSSTTSLRLTGYSLVLDLDVRGKTVAVVGSSEDGWWVSIIDTSESHTVVERCVDFPSIHLGVIATGVAVDRDGRAWVLTREPAALVLAQAGAIPPHPIEVIPLSDESVEDTGHTLFHTPTPQGVACVSCHPEGREDGLVWTFEDDGPRRTQALNVPLEGTAPFHWDGEMADLHQIANEVFEVQMAGRPLEWTHEEALARWVFSLAERPGPTPDDGLATGDAAAISRGRQLFTELACATCHAGPYYTNHELARVPGQQPLQVPSLIGVRWRPPYLHDGRAPDLHAAIEAMPLPRTPTTPQRGDLIAFLRSL